MLQEMKRSYDDMKNDDNRGGAPESMEIDATEDTKSRRDLMTLLSRPSPFANESGALPIGEFEPMTLTRKVVTADMTESTLTKAKVLVVGAGGLGCELLKNLALSGISDVHVIDLDTIDITNLNRQFLFRMKDVGSSKAKVAAAFVNERCPWMKVVAHHGMIQDKDPSFYRSFNCIISGLDNVEARRWLNATVVGLVEFDSDGDPDPTTIIPIVDGGTEGFAGQARRRHRNRRTAGIPTRYILIHLEASLAATGSCPNASKISSAHAKSGMRGGISSREHMTNPRIANRPSSRYRPLLYARGINVSAAVNAPTITLRQVRFPTKLPSGEHSKQLVSRGRMILACIGEAATHSPRTKEARHS